MDKKAIVLLSGGVDSATVLFMAKEEGFEVYALTFDYGQKNLFEIECAEKIARIAGTVSHKVLKIDLGSFGGSTLTSGEGFNPSGEIPDTYVPARNTVFLSFALSWAEAERAAVVFYGATAVDFSGYPDCTEEFIEAFNELARKGLSKPVVIKAPLLKMSKKQIVQKGIALGVDYSLTNSCYFPDKRGVHCGKCASCKIRFKALKGVCCHAEGL